MEDNTPLPIHEKTGADLATMNLDLEAALLTLGTTLVGLLLPSLRGEYQIRICTKDPHGRTPFSLCHLHLVDWLTVAVILTPVKPASVSVPPRQVWGCSAAGPAACGHEALSLSPPFRLAALRMAGTDLEMAGPWRSLWRTLADRPSPSISKSASQTQGSCSCSTKDDPFRKEPAAAASSWKC